MSVEETNGGPESEIRRNLLVASGIATIALALSPFVGPASVEAASVSPEITPEELFENFANYVGQSIRIEILIYPDQNTGEETLIHAQIPTSKLEQLFIKKATKAHDIRRFLMFTHSLPPGTPQTRENPDYSFEIASALPLNPAPGQYILEGSVCTGYTGPINNPTAVLNFIDVQSLSPKPVS